MTKNTPVITVTCYRDLPLLDLQAQGIYQYLDKDTPVYLIVNEDDVAPWLDFFDKNIRHYYKNHQLTVMFRESFYGDWTQWIPSAVNPWAVGWETQQILKLAIATRLESDAFLICDTQNFLIRNWSPNQYSVPENKIPYRTGTNGMPKEIWDDYSKILDVDLNQMTSRMMSTCTPIFMHTQLVQELINAYGGIEKFSRWFKYASRIKSEFVLYAIWTIKHGGIERLHHQIHDYAGPYLRDCNTADEFNKFIGFIGVHKPHAWVSSNHRAWGNMTDEQYSRLKEKLETFNLKLNFDEYRSTYVDLKF